MHARQNTLTSRGAGRELESVAISIVALLLDLLCVLAARFRTRERVHRYGLQLATTTPLGQLLEVAFPLQHLAGADPAIPST